MLVVDPSCFFMSTGKTTRQNAEYVVLGRRGNPTRHSTTVHQILTDPRREHSRKPDSFFASVERYVSPASRKLEMFARQERPGWTVWGNETDKFRSRARVSNG
jgi:N6-adenosine-specific RNA methylase IME4